MFTASSGSLGSGHQGAGTVWVSEASGVELGDGLAGGGGDGLGGEGAGRPAAALRVRRSPRTPPASVTSHVVCCVSSPTGGRPKPRSGWARYGVLHAGHLVGGQGSLEQHELGSPGLGKIGVEPGGVVGVRVGEEATAVADQPLDLKRPPSAGARRRHRPFVCSPSEFGVVGDDQQPEFTGPRGTGQLDEHGGEHRPPARARSRGRRRPRPS